MSSVQSIVSRLCWFVDRLRLDERVKTRTAHGRTEKEGHGRSSQRHRHSETRETQILRNNRATDKARCTDVGERWAVGTSIGAACVQLATCIGRGKVTGMGGGEG